MIGTREICALLLAGGMGAGSVVGVQQAQPAIKKARVSRPAPKPKVRRAVARPAPAPTVALNDCPSITAPLGTGIAGLAPLPSLDSVGNGGAGPEYAGGYLPAGYGVPGWPGWYDAGSGGGGSVPGGDPTPPDPGDGGNSIPGGDPVPGVPQPASWVMMIAGFGLVGLALRRDTAGSAVGRRRSRQA